MIINRLLLIDGHALAYRAFYAIKQLSTRAGRPTNAVYGFVKMLEQLRRNWKPSHGVVVFDGGLPAGRMELLPEYKAQRDAMPEALQEQFEWIENYLAAARIGVLRLDGEEADDVLATLAKTASSTGAEVLLATHDKDLFQLVSAAVSVIPPTKSDERLGPAEIKQKTGVHPDQIAEWLALIGDTADNIPGVPGVGPKTAARLLNEYHSVEGVYSHLADIKQDKLRANLEQSRDVVMRNLKMTRLRTDMVLPLNWQEWPWSDGDADQLFRFFKAMEFDSMARALEAPTFLDL